MGFKKTYEREVEELEGQLALLKDKQAAEALRREAGDTEKYGRWLPYFFAVKRSLSEAPFR